MFSRLVLPFVGWGVFRRCRGLWGAGLILAFALLPVVESLAADAPWWDKKWRYRRKLRPREQSGSRATVAWAEFSIPEGCEASGADVRVVTSGGGEVSSKVMFFKPGLYGIVAFDRGGGAGPYWLYMGNPQARAGRSWEPKAGVFLETWRRSKGHGNDWAGMEKMLESANYSFGAGYRSQVYDGFNPFGETDNFLSVYTGWFEAPRAGEYLFATISDEGSFLFVDDRKVCEWPGFHTAQGGRRGEHSGKVSLTAGVHKLSYYHFDMRQTQTMMAAWQTPGSKKLEVIPAEAFVPVVGCYVDELQDSRSAVVVDFQHEQVEWLEMEEHTYLIYRFDDVSYAPGAKSMRREWKFSDGTTYTGDPVEKLFLHKGFFRVTLTVTDDTGRSASTTRPLLVHPIDKIERSDLYDLAFQFLKAMKTTPLTELGAEDILSAAYLLRDQRHLAEAVKLYQDFIEHEWRGKKRVNTGILRQVTALADSGYGKFDEIETYIQGLAGRLGPQAPERAEVLFILGGLQLKGLGDAGKALTTLQSAKLALPYSDNAALEREALIAIGDGYRALGKADEARQNYERAQAIALPQQTAHDYDVSSYALTAEAYIRRDNLDEAEAIINEWERKFPTERLVGYSSTLRARVLALRGKRREAASEIETYLRLKPQGVFLQNALLELGDIYAKLGQTAQARETYERLLQEFETQATRQQVEDKLKQLDQGAGKRAEGRKGKRP